MAAPGAAKFCQGDIDGVGAARVGELQVQVQRAIPKGIDQNAPAQLGRQSSQRAQSGGRLLGSGWRERARPVGWEKRERVHVFLIFSCRLVVSSAADRLQHPAKTARD
jgi:hypothetical protein